MFSKKERYRCVEYGVVLSELLQSYGFITRTVALRSNDVAYGGFGQGHVAMEVWSNELQKWIFLDPQFSTYLSHDGTILNVYEVYELKKHKKWNKIKVESPKKLNKKEKLSYKKFLVNYLGHMSVSGKEKAVKISLFLETKKTILTFQGMIGPKVVFTDDPSEIYPQVNRVTILLDFKEKISNFKNLVKKLDIKTNDDYLKNMHKFSAVPKFTVHLKNNMPLFDFYEYRFSTNSQWIKVKKDKFDWSAKGAKNLLEVRAVNQFGRVGPITYIKLAYM